MLDERIVGFRFVVFRGSSVLNLSRFARQVIKGVLFVVLTLPLFPFFVTVREFRPFVAGEFAWRIIGRAFLRKRVGFRLESDQTVLTFHDPDVDQTYAEDDRSEERRVGKECRSRWSP